MPPEAPSVRVPVLPKVTALVMVPLVPVSDTLFTLLFTTKLAGLTAPVKLTVPPILSSVNVPVPVNDVPETSAPATEPVERVRLKVDPVTAPKLISPALLVALVLSVVFAPKVTGPNVIAALVELIVPFTVVADGKVAVIPPA